MTYPKLTLNDVKQAANGRWVEILTALGVPEHLLNTKKHQPCPACGGKNRFRFTDNGGRGWWICNQCAPQGGSGFDLLMLVFGCDFNEALKRVAECLGMGGTRHAHAFRLPEKRPTPQNAPQEDEQQREKLTQIWTSSKAWQTHNVIVDYLRGRGIPQPENLPIDDNALRVHAALPYWHNGKLLGRFPAMVGAFRAHGGELVGLHLTYLMKKQGMVSKIQLRDFATQQPLGAKKHRSMYSGALMGAAIPLFRQPEQELKGVLVVCEGIETAIAIHCVNGLNVWACGAANRIAGFRLPEWVKRLIIVADNDPNQTGLNAAQTLQRRYHSALKGNIRIWLPENDNDVLDLLARQTQNQG